MISYFRIFGGHRVKRLVFVCGQERENLFILSSTFQRQNSLTDYKMGEFSIDS